jgi:MoxR-like ATPase
MDGFSYVEPELSGQQSEALDEICHWRERGTEPSYFLSGWAGTGKTTLARRAAKEIGGVVHFSSVTGRACAVMARKGCEPVDTLDHLLYRRQRVEYCADDPPCKKVCAGRCRHKREAYDDKRLDPETPLADANLIILDEVSMLGPPDGPRPPVARRAGARAR